MIKARLGFFPYLRVAFLCIHTKYWRLVQKCKDNPLTYHA